jgi:myo-inositol-1(or 4)-monophosphatase
MSDFLLDAEKAAMVIAKEAGKILLKHNGKELNIEVKGGNSRNVVTIADKESDEFIRSELSKRFPDHGIITEENDPKEGNEYTWHIDPLDGTTAYSRGGDFFCVSIALAKEEEVVVGVIYHPLSGAIYHAAKGHGAFSNADRIHVSDVGELEQAIIYTDLGYRNHIRERVVKSMLELQKDIRSFKIKGSGALSICEIASGHAEGYYYLSSTSWDYAAAAIITREAGGVVTDLQGQEWTPDSKSIVALNKKLSTEAFERISKAAGQN